MTRDFRDVRGLADLWGSMNGVAPAKAVPLRALLDTLGLGLGQTMHQLGHARPDWATFLAWAEATASGGEPAAIARYHAWYDGQEPPAAERDRQAAILALPPVFDDAEMRAWDADGVVVLRGAICPQEAAAIAEHLWAVQGATPGDPASWYDNRAGGIMVERFQHPAMEVPRRSLRIARGFAQLYGHADLIASVDRLSFNPPVTPTYAFPGPELHWDANLTPPIALELQGILYLTDTAADQGALRVVPGFHRRLAEGWLEALNGSDPRGVDLTGDAVPIPASAGDLVIWRQELPHGASANTTDRPRLAQYVTLYPMFWPDGRDWV